MDGRTILRFQIGQKEAIWTVARSKAAFWTGIVLVLITAIPRNYDQHSISEHTFRWMFGPLGFSLISGTWTFLVAYGIGTAAGIRRSGTGRQSGLSDWMAFMGLFWMTAPIAWLYAIPVERFLDPVTAAQANVTLLAIVASWRVVLMARVLQVACDWAFGQALSWVLVAASAEVFALGFFGGAFGRQLMAGMGGMRMSPAEEVISSTFVGAMFLAVPIFVLSSIFALVYGTRGSIQALPARQANQVPGRFLSATALIWAAIAIWPQIQVSRSAELDRLVAAEHYTEALYFMDSQHRSHFAPSRELPPKAYERALYEQLPAMIAAADETTTPWVWQHLLMKLDVLLSHLKERSRSQGLGVRWDYLLHDIAEVESGRAWIESNKFDIATVLIGRKGIFSNDRADDEADQAALRILENEWGVTPAMVKPE